MQLMMKRLSIGLALCIVQTGFAVTVRVAPTADDATPAVLKALAEVRAAGGGVVEFAAGEYHFRAASATPMKFFISNQTQSDVHPVQIPLVGLKGVALKGHGSRFILHGATICCVVMDSENVTLEGLSLDWNRPFITEATVVRFEGADTLVSIDRVQFPYEVRNGTFEAVGEDWRSDSNTAIAFRGDNQALVEGSVDIGWNGRAETVSPDVVRLKHDFASVGVKPGDRIALRHGAWRYPATVVYRARNTLFEDVVIHTAWGVGLICQRSETLTWRGTRPAAERVSGVFAPKGSGRFATTHADATHFSNVRGHVKIENCLFEGMMDDAINVHSTCLQIVERLSPNCLRCRFAHGQTYGFEVFRPGEVLRFIKGRTLENGPTCAIADVRTPNPREVIVTGSVPFPAEYGVGDAVENADYQPSVEYRDNVVSRNRARGALFTTPRPVVVTGNLFDFVSGAAILFAGDAQGWFESGSCENVLIARNTFRNCNASYYQFCDGILSFAPTVREPAAQSRRYHRNIVISGNTFETFKTPLVSASSTEKLLFVGNRIIYNDDIRWGRPYVGPFAFTNCAEMQVDVSASETRSSF